MSNRYVPATVTVTHQEGATYFAQCSKRAEQALATLATAIASTPGTANVNRHPEKEGRIQFDLVSPLTPTELSELGDEWAAWLH